MGATTIVRPDITETTPPSMEDLPIAYIAYEHLNAADLAVLIQSFDAIHEVCRSEGSAEDSEPLRIQGVETRASLAIAFFSVLSHYGPIVFHAFKEVASTALVVYQILKIKKDLKGKASKPQAPSSESALAEWEEMTPEKRDAIKEHAAAMAEHFAKAGNIRVLVLGDGQSIAVPRLPATEERGTIYASFDAFDEWRDRQSRRGEHRTDTEAVMAWLETEGYEYLKNHYDIYLFFNNFLVNRGLEITHVLSYQSFMEGYRRQVARGKR